MSQCYVLRSSGYAQKILEGLQDLLEADLCTDVELEDASGEVVKTHMLILAAVSPFLKTYANAGQNQGPVRLLFSDVQASHWHQILTFLYTGELTVELNQVEELRNIVAGLQITELDMLLKEAKELMPEPVKAIIQPKIERVQPEDDDGEDHVDEDDHVSLPPPQTRKNTRNRLSLCPGEKFQGPFGEVEVGNVLLSESEKLLKVNQAFGHVTVKEDALLSSQNDQSTPTSMTQETEMTLDNVTKEEETEITQSAEASTVKPKLEPSEKLFKCNKCDALLAYGEEIDEHMEAHLKASKDYACAKCNKSFIDEEHLIKHEKSHNKPKKIEQCRFCTRIYNFQHLVDKHVIREHLAESGLDAEALPCDQCEERFATETLLNYHKKRSHRRRRVRDSDSAETPCPLCQTVTASIVEHMKSAHPASPAYQCRYCPAMFVKIRTRKTHVEKQHRRVVCKYCGRHEPSHDALLKHLPLCAHAPKEHRDAWARKIKDSHTRVYNCSHCDLKFRALNHLRKHEKDAHGTYQMLQCHICLKKMPSSCAFKDHVMRHLGLRPFACTHCPKKFTSSSDLTRHVKNMHTAAPAYRCHLCSKAFRDCSNFYAHGRKAHGEDFRGLLQKAQNAEHVAGTPPQLTSIAEMKVSELIAQIQKECSGSHKDPAMCPICHKLFTKRSNLFTHGRKLHKINFTLLLKGRYSQYTYLREIVKANKGDEEEEEEAEEDGGASAEEELTANVEMLVDRDDTDMNYDAIEMVEVENMDEAFKEDGTIIVEHEDGTVMRLYEMPQDQ